MEKPTYNTTECQYESKSIDRREAYYERSAKYRNAENDFGARYERGDKYQKGMWRPRLNNVSVMQQPAKKAQKAR